MFYTSSIPSLLAFLFALVLLTGCENQQGKQVSTADLPWPEAKVQITGSRLTGESLELMFPSYRTDKSSFSVDHLGDGPEPDWLKKIDACLQEKKITIDQFSMAVIVKIDKEKKRRYVYLLQNEGGDTANQTTLITC